MPGSVPTLLHPPQPNRLATESGPLVETPAVAGQPPGLFTLIEDPPPTIRPALASLDWSALNHDRSALIYVRRTSAAADAAQDEALVGIAVRIVDLQTHAVATSPVRHIDGLAESGDAQRVAILASLETPLLIRTAVGPPAHQRRALAAPRLQRPPIHPFK